MAQEIERKFLVKGDYKPHALSSSHIIQGYISSDAGRTVRVRLRDDRAYLTIKGASTDGGISRFEWETEIAARDALQLLTLAQGPLIDKRRYIVKVDGHTFEVDEFYGDNEGLTLAEIELSSVDEAFPRPDWLGAEVTGDRRYYNSHLRAHPYKDWK